MHKYIYNELYILGHVGYIGQAQARLDPGEFLQAGPGFTIA